MTAAITGTQVQQTLGITNPTKAETTDTNNIAGDLNGTRNNLKGDVIQLMKDDPQLGTGSGGATQSGGANQPGGADQPGGAQNGGSNQDAMIQMIMALLMQLLQNQGSNNNNSNGSQNSSQSPPPVTGA